MSDEQIVQVSKADFEVVKALCDHLVDAFEKFANNMHDKDPEGLRYVDALMGIHNFYKAIILDLEERSEDTKGVWRAMAVGTLKQALQKGKR